MENYEELYKKALSRAAFYNNELLTENQRKMLLDIFPELKESEDELTRKSLISFLKSPFVHENITDEKVTPWIAWLEKQGEVAYNPYKATVESIANMCNKYATKMNNKEDANDFLQNVKVKCKDTIEFEKQDESPITNIEIPFGANDSELQEVSYNIPKGFYAEIKDDRVVIKKVEPKFKVGDWVILNGVVAKILDKQKYGFVGLDIDGKDFFCNYGHTDSMRLWTINDAKNGDVLAYVTDEEDLWIMIYQSLYEPYEGHVHYHALLVNDNFSDKGTCCICIDNLKPATKEQRDLLFKKIHDAGYEWDAEKKKLKKIEVESKEGKDEREELILYLKGIRFTTVEGAEQVRNWITWLDRQSKKLDADKVIAWLVANICDYEYYVKRFKQDFGL